jgi:hypothetical protein
MHCTSKVGQLLFPLRNSSDESDIELTDAVSVSSERGSTFPVIALNPLTVLAGMCKPLLRWMNRCSCYRETQETGNSAGRERPPPAARPEPEKWEGGRRDGADLS